MGSYRLVGRFQIAVTLLLLFSFGRFALADDRPFVEVRIPGETGKRPLYVLNGGPQLSIPIFDADRKQRAIVEKQVLIVSDKRDLYGVLVPVAEGYFGTLVNQSLKVPLYYQFSPNTPITQSRISALSNAPLEPKEILASDLLAATRCDVEPVSQPVSLRIAQREALESAGGTREVELFVVSPSEFVQGRSDETIVAQTVATIAAANIFFEPVQLEIVLRGIQILRAETDPYLLATQAFDADRMLQTVRTEWASQSEVTRDAVVVFGAGRYKSFDIQGKVQNPEVFGLAYTGTICTNPEYSVLFATQGGLNTKGELSLSATLAHELGHILGMNHDTTLYNGVPSLMYPSFSLNPSGFSAQSRKELEIYGGRGKNGGSCLANSSPTVSEFEGGPLEVVKLKEGERFARTIKINSGGSALSALELTGPAKFDADSSQLTFSADYSLVDKLQKTRRFSQHFAALDDSGRVVRKEIVFEVSDVNRAPIIRSKSASPVFERNGVLEFSIRFVDADGDELSLSRSTLRAMNMLRGRKNVRFKDGYLNFRWLPARGSKIARLNFTVTDGVGETTAIMRIGRY